MNREERLDDSEESLRLAMENAQSQIWTALPAVVVSVNLGAQTLVAQPTVQGSVAAPNGAKQSVNLPVLVDVPIVWPRAGGFALTFPIKAGDEVLVVFASRCIDAWWQSGGIGAPAEARMHDLSDGFAILAPTSQAKKLTGVSPTNVQLRNESGSTYVEITHDGKARVVSSTQVDVVAPTINLTGSLNVNGAMNLIGNLAQSGGSMNIGGIVFGAHKHTGVRSSSDISGGPVN